MGFLPCWRGQGKRTALPNSRVMIHQPIGRRQGQATDIEIHAREILDCASSSTRSGRAHRPAAGRSATPSATTSATCRRGQEYGLIDQVIDQKRPVAADAF